MRAPSEKRLLRASYARKGLPPHNPDTRESRLWAETVDAMDSMDMDNYEKLVSMPPASELSRRPSRLVGGGGGLSSF